MELIIVIAFVLSIVSFAISISGYVLKMSYPEGGITIEVEQEDGAYELSKAHDGDASFDLLIKKDTPLHQGRQILETGLKLKMPKGYHAFIMPTSGNSLKGMNARLRDEYGVHERRVSGDVRIGTIDNNYRGNLGVIFDCYEDITEDIFIPDGIKVAQLWVVKEVDAEVNYGKINDTTERGNGAWGTTDKVI